MEWDVQFWQQLEGNFNKFVKGKNIQQLFPKSVICLEGNIEEICKSDQIYPEEFQFIKKSVNKRKNEFIAGRILAKQALSILGINNFPILMNKDQLRILGVLFIIVGLMSFSLINPVLMMAFQVRTPVAEISGQTENWLEGFIISLGILFVFVAIGLAILLYAEKRTKKK